MSVSDEPRLVNLVEVDTRWGPRAFELHHGDATSFPDPVDLLAVSVVAGDLRALAQAPGLYAQVSHTLIGSLHERAGLDVGELSVEPAFDLKTALGWWVSKPTGHERFRRVACVEDIGFAVSVEEATENLFALVALLEAKGIEIRRMLVPVLGAGGADLDPEPVVRGLLEAARRHLPRLAHLERVCFIELNPAKVERLDEAMDRVLGRDRIAAPKGELVAVVRRELGARLDRAEALANAAQSRLIHEVRRVVDNEASRSFELGIMGRRLVELVVTDLEPTAPSKRRAFELWRRIDRLADDGVADWIRSYMHVLRVLGNESAHERDRGERRPPAVRDADLAVCLLCMQRVLEFWLEVRTG